MKKLTKNCNKHSYTKSSRFGLFVASLMGHNHILYLLDLKTNRIIADLWHPDSERNPEYHYFSDRFEPWYHYDGEKEGDWLFKKLATFETEEELKDYVTMAYLL